MSKSVSGSTILCLCLAVLILLLYIRYYVGVNPHFELLQMKLHLVQVHHMMEKLPIVLEESIVNPLELLNTLFKYLYVYKTSYVISGEISENPITSKTNYARFILLCSSSDNTKVNLVHPNKKNAVQIVLRKNKCLIIPCWWMFNVEGGSATVYELYDIISLLHSW